MLQQSGNYFCWETFARGRERLCILAGGTMWFFLSGWISSLPFFLVFSKSIPSCVMHRGGKTEWGCLSCAPDTSETTLFVTDAVFKHCKIEFSLNVALTRKCNLCVFAAEKLLHEQDGVSKLLCFPVLYCQKSMGVLDSILESFFSPWYCFSNHSL